MKDVLIALMLVLGVWLYMDNVKKETAILSLSAQISEQDARWQAKLVDENKKNTETIADLRKQLGDKQGELVTANGQIADLRSKLPANTWIQERVEKSKSALEQPPAVAPFKRTYGTGRTWVDSAGVTHTN